MEMKIRVVLATLFVAAIVPACARPSETPKAESATLNVTDWTDKTELYMEYPPLVAGQTALFAVHLTKLSDFTPVNTGRARIEFAPEAGGLAKVLEGPEPSRPGAFRVEGVPPAPGRYR